MNCPTSIAQHGHVAAGAPQADPDVGEILRRMDVARTLSAEELEQHIADCSTLWQCAYARFQEHGNPADREEAVLWLHTQNEAILMRPGMDVFLPGASSRGGRADA